MCARNLLLVTFCTVFAPFLSAKEPLVLEIEDKRILPGATFASLQKLFGADAVVESEFYVGEGSSEPGAMIYPDDETKSIEILWSSEGKISAARIIGEGAGWALPYGLKTGMSLQDVEKLNGKPFKLYGFGWDYGGTTFSFEGGAMEVSEEDPTRITLAFDFPEDAPLTEEEFGKIAGERGFLSTHPLMRKAKLKLASITVLYSP